MNAARARAVAVDADARGVGGERSLEAVAVGAGEEGAGGSLLLDGCGSLRVLALFVLRRTRRRCRSSHGRARDRKPRGPRQLATPCWGRRTTGNKGVRVSSLPAD